MNRLLYVVALLFGMSLAAPALALESLDKEMVYRTNLGRADDVTLLLKQGASANQADDNGVPLLALAASRHDDEGLNVMQALLKGGADINGKDKEGETALFYAGRQGNMDAVKFLLAQGIDYYTTDKNGDIARNIAYSAGHKDITQAMDDFVKAQSAKVQEQYKQFNKTIADRYSQPAETPPEPASASAGSTPLPTSLPKSDAALAVESEPEPAAANDEQAKALEAALQKAGPELAFNSCAFQYWYYCDAVKQSTDLSADALANMIDDYKKKTTTLQQQLIKDGQDADKVNRVVSSAQKRIYNKLNAMPSNIYRHEHDVGSTKNMESACKAIARNWDEAPPRKLAQPEAMSEGAGNNGAIKNSRRQTPHSAAEANQPRKSGKAKNTDPLSNSNPMNHLY